MSGPVSEVSDENEAARQRERSISCKNQARGNTRKPLGAIAETLRRDETRFLNATWFSNWVKINNTDTFFNASLSGHGYGFCP